MVLFVVLIYHLYYKELIKPCTRDKTKNRGKNVTLTTIKPEQEIAQPGVLRGLFPSLLSEKSQSGPVCSSREPWSLRSLVPKGAQGSSLLQGCGDVDSLPTQKQGLVALPLPKPGTSPPARPVWGWGKKHTMSAHGRHL